MAVLTIVGYFVLMSICAFIWPGTALAVAAIFYGFEQWGQANSSFFAQHSQLMNYLAAIVAFIGVASAIMKGYRPLKSWPTVAWIVFGFYLYFALTWFWSADPKWTMVLYRHQLPYLFVFTLMTPLVLNSEKDFKHAIYAMCIMGGLMLVLLASGTQVREGGRAALLQEGVVDRYGQERKQGNPLALASVAASVIFASVLPHFRGASSPLVLFRVLALPLGLLLIFRSDSRGQMVAMVLVLAAVYPLRWPRVNLRLVVGIPVMVGIVLVLMTWAVSFSENAESRWDVSNFGSAYSSTRAVMCAEVLAAWVRSSPWNLVFGLGLGASWGIVGIYPHVIPVQVLAEGGLVGAAIYLALLVVMAKSIIWLFRRSKASLETRGFICFVVAMAGFDWVLGLKQGGIHGMYPLMMMFIIVGRFEVIAKRSLRERKQQQFREKARRLLWAHSQQPAELAPS